MDKCYTQNAVFSFLHFSLSLAPLARFPQSFSLQWLRGVYYQDLLPLFIKQKKHTSHVLPREKENHGG